MVLKDCVHITNNPKTCGWVGQESISNISISYVDLCTLLSHNLYLETIICHIR